MNRWYFAIACAGLGVAAAPAQAQDREPVKARVKLNDLNLESRAGQRAANDRIEDAARDACGTGGIADAADNRRCRAEVKTSGAATVAMEQSRDRAERQRYARVAKRYPQRARYRHCYWSKRYHKRVCVWRRR